RNSCTSILARVYPDRIPLVYDPTHHEHRRPDRLPVLPPVHGGAPFWRGRRPAADAGPVLCLPGHLVRSPGKHPPGAGGGAAAVRAAARAPRRAAPPAGATAGLPALQPAPGARLRPGAG